MTRQPVVARRAEELLGSPVVATAPVAGGDISTSHRLRLADGRMVFMKTHPHAPSGFFEAEADGLDWLRVPEGAPVPEVLAVAADCLILPWLEPGKTSNEAADAFGAALARTHGHHREQFGRDRDGFIGRLPMPNKPTEDWAEFYATRRVLPYLKLARDRGHASAEDAAPIEALLPRIGDLVPTEPPATLHGDLWSGNVVWGLEDTGWVVDPAAYAGHRELDLAMLALFGVPGLPRILDAYQETAPLAEGWEDRVGIHQLFPLLVHACMFGGGYAARAAATALRY